nr:50S ribosomal protein L40e [uncultured Methanobrevibacter sp.]
MSKQNPSFIKGNLTPENKRIAANRNINIKICLKCHCHNSIKATKCRKCGYKGLRLKSKQLERRG